MGVSQSILDTTSTMSDNNMTENIVSESIKLVTFSKIGDEGTQIFFNEGRIKEFLSKINFPVHILAFTGEARIGKSTFINTLITYIMKKNTIIFKTSATIEHCTVGIDICVIKTKENNNYLILDVQGINHGDSSNDCKLMLIPYEIANMLIHNDVSKVNNTTLKGLEPVNLFERYIPNINEKDNKPILMFRVRDWGLHDSIDDALMYTLTEQKDQFEPLRSTICRLFSSVRAVKTEPLTKAQMMLLNTQQYDKMLEDDTSGFAEACKQILEIVEKTEKKIINIETASKFEHMIKQINDNKKIDYTCLDVSTLRLKNDLNEFMSEIDGERMYKIYEIDASNDCHYKCTIRRDLMKGVLKEFNNMFDKCDPMIVTPVVKKITDRLDMLQQNIHTCEHMAKIECMKALSSCIDDKKYIDMISKFTTTYDIGDDKPLINARTNIDQILEQYIQLTSYFAKPSVEYIADELVRKKMYIQLLECYTAHEKNIVKEVNKIINLNDVCILNILNLTHIQTNSMIDIEKTYDTQPFRQRYHDDWISQHHNGVYDAYHTTHFAITCNDKLCDVEIFTENINDHNVIIDKFNDHAYYIDKINKYFENTLVFDCYNKHLSEKINILFEKDNSLNEKYLIVKTHPQLNFVICETSALLYFIDIFNKHESVIFLEDKFNKFVIDYFMIINNDFNPNIFKNIFLKENRVAKLDEPIYQLKNAIELEMRSSKCKNRLKTIARYYAINKIKEWYGGIALESFK
jgi:hypothetical protein